MSQITPYNHREPAGAAAGKRAMRPVPALILVGFAALVSPFAYPHASAIEMGVVALCWVGAAGLIKLSRRLGDARVIAGPGGVLLRGPLRERHLSWDEIRVFRPGHAAGTAAQAGTEPIVVAELADGTELPVQALSLAAGGTHDGGRVAQLCAELEARRPLPAGPA